MNLSQLPEDLNAEVLLNSDIGHHLLVKHDGTHHRNVSHDIAGIEMSADGSTPTLLLGRSSLYHTLPESMFHAVDRFDGLDDGRDSDAFAHAYAQQQREQEQALELFAPIDALLLQLRLDVRRVIDRYAHENTVLQSIIGDNLSAEQRNNRYIRQLLCYLPHCSNIRGNKTLITLMLRKLMRSEGLRLEVGHQRTCCHDDEPRYHYTLDGLLENCYAGNDYDHNQAVWSMHYWDPSLCDARFLDTLAELEVLRQWVQDWFLAVGQVLRLDVYDPDSPAVRLSDNECYNYLNYNVYL